MLKNYNLTCLIALFINIIFASFPAYADKAVPAWNFIDSMGINTHIGGNSAQTAAITETQLTYLGIKYARDTYNLFHLADYQAVNAAIGTKYDMVIGGNQTDYATKISQNLANRNFLTAIEGPNEINLENPTCNDASNYITCGKEFQQWLMRDASSVLIPLYTLTDTATADIPSLASLPADFVSSHIYTQGLASSAVYSGLSFAVTSFAGLNPIKIPEITETGWWTVPCTDGVTQNVQAKYILNSYFDSYILNSDKLYIYELNDGLADTPCTTKEDHFGLFNYDGTTKVSAIAVHNLTALLADNFTFRTDSLSFSFSGSPANQHQLLMEKIDGSFWLAIWNDVQIWNNSTHQEITVAPVSVTVNLGITASKINVYDPYIDTTVQQTANNVSSLLVSVPDHVILVKIIP